MAWLGTAGECGGPVRDPFVQLQLAQYERATRRPRNGRDDSHAGSLTGGGAEGRR